MAKGHLLSPSALHLLEWLPSSSLAPLASGVHSDFLPRPQPDTDWQQSAIWGRTWAADIHLKKAEQRSPAGWHGQHRHRGTQVIILHIPSQCLASAKLHRCQEGHKIKASSLNDGSIPLLKKNIFSKKLRFRGRQISKYKCIDYLLSQYPRAGSWLLLLSAGAGKVSWTAWCWWKWICHLLYGRLWKRTQFISFAQSSIAHCPHEINLNYNHHPGASYCTHNLCHYKRSEPASLYCFHIMYVFHVIL